MDRIGFWGILCHNYNKEAPKIIWATTKPLYQTPIIALIVIHIDPFGLNTKPRIRPRCRKASSSSQGTMLLVLSLGFRV